MDAVVHLAFRPKNKPRIVNTGESFRAIGQSRFDDQQSEIPAWKITVHPVRWLAFCGIDIYVWFDIFIGRVRCVRMSPFISRMP
jgi:hypothetical protein